MIFIGLAGYGFAGFGIYVMLTGFGLEPMHSAVTTICMAMGVVGISIEQGVTVLNRNLQELIDK